MIDPRSGEREDTPEQDADRQKRSEAMYLGRIVERLLAAKVRFVDQGYLKALDLRINIHGGLPTAADVEQIKRMAWEYRRTMPAHIAPKLPPHDPIVKEMGL